MKKWLVILLISAYAVIISGVEVSMHYCCGKLESVSVWSDTSKECCAKQNDVSCSVGKHCCETTHITASQRTPHTNINFSIDTPQFTNLVGGFPFSKIELINLKETINPRDSGLDPPIKRHRFLLFSSLVYYA